VDSGFSFRLRLKVLLDGLRLALLRVLWHLLEVGGDIACFGGVEEVVRYELRCLATR
jgi:hypothetical protein